MLVLIYGSQGFIGKKVIDLLNKYQIKFIEGKERVDNDKALYNEIINYQPTHVLSLIGRTHGEGYSTIDYLEQEGKLVENVRDNLYSPVNLALFCEDMKIHCTIMSTGCIFDYDNEHNEIGFAEEDVPNFFGSSYSVVKGFTDRILKKLNVLSLRLRMPITEDNSPRNFITKITTYDKICSIKNSMSVLPELLPCMIEMMQNRTVGTINFTNPGVISHNEILEMYKEIVDPDFTWTNFTIEEQNKILSSKRSNNKLNTTRLERLFPNLKNIHDAVRDCLKLYPKPEIVYDNSTILVTGGCGFIGSNFINHIFDKYKNVKIVNIDAMYYCSNENNVKKHVRTSDRYLLLKMNLNDIVGENILQQYNINYVVHFAAQSHVQNSFSDSLSYTYDNVVGTHTLLEECRIYNKVKKFIHVSTDEVYGESELSGERKTELSLLNPTNPYAGTKAAAEFIARSYLCSFNLPIVITRGNNVYGENQYPEKLIPKFIHHLKNNEKVTIQGKGNALRSFLHISDVVTAFDVVLKKGKVSETYNIGGDDHEYSVFDIAKILIKKIKNTNKFEDWIEYVEDRPFNDIRYHIDNKKLKQLGWKIIKDFDHGISELIDN
jgi:dTDP-glucose 4,6-dehydratase